MALLTGGRSTIYVIAISGRRAYFPKESNQDFHHPVIFSYCKVFSFAAQGQMLFLPR